MGYAWPVKVQDDDTGEWVGEQRSELVELRPLFEHLIQKLDVAGEATAEDWRAALPPEVKLIQTLGPHTAHVRVKGGEVEDVVVKIDPPSSGGGLRRLTDQVRHSRAQRRYLWGHRLRALGIDTPRPLGFVERAHQPARSKSFVASEYIYAPSLIEFKDEKVRARLGADAVLEKRALIRKVADLLRELHARRFVPPGLSGRHVRVAGGAVVLCEIDDLDGAASLDNLVALCREFSDDGVLTRADRMRFLDAYVRHAPERASERRALFLAVGAASAT